MVHHEGAGEDVRVRRYELVLEEDGRLNAFDLEVVLRTLLLRFNFRLVSIHQTDDLNLTPEDEDQIAEMLRAANLFREAVSVCLDCGAIRREIFHEGKRVSIHTSLRAATCVDHEWMGIQ